MATAKASRLGRTLRTSGARTAIVARLAAIAMNRNATIDAVTPPNIRATPDDNNVNRGPYTAGVPTHRGPTYCASGSDGKSDGVATYGFAEDCEERPSGQGHSEHGHRYQGTPVNRVEGRQPGQPSERARGPGRAGQDRLKGRAGDRCDDRNQHDGRDRAGDGGFAGRGCLHGDRL